MFVNTSMMGMDMAFPDVCLTPAVPTPIPVPYPNIAMGPMAITNQTTVFIEAMPVHNLATKIPSTLGDDGGELGGVVSGKDGAESKHSQGAESVLIGGMPVTRLTSTSLQNSTNTEGIRLVPSQVKVLVLAP